MFAIQFLKSHPPSPWATEGLFYPSVKQKSRAFRAWLASKASLFLRRVRVTYYELFVKLWGICLLQAKRPEKDYFFAKKIPANFFDPRGVAKLPVLLTGELLGHHPDDQREYREEECK